MIREAAYLGIVLLDPMAKIILQETIEHVERLVDGGGNDLGEVQPLAVY